MLELTPYTRDFIKLADWLELMALISADGNSSYGDLSSALRRTGAYEFNEDNPDEDGSFQDERIDEMCGEVFSEIHQRIRSAAHAYPFEVEGNVLCLKSSLERNDFVPYIFCLSLSYFGVPTGVGSHIPRRLFEDLSCYAARNFLGGEATKLSNPRDDLPSSFAGAIYELCTRLGEGDGYREQKDSLIRPQDDRVDVVAWRHFPDRLPSKLILFGQCASNQYWEDWRSKLSELQPREFCEQWMLTQPVPIPIKSFFIPHRLELGRWTYAARYAGILFDRCRIAYWSHKASAYVPHMTWMKEVYIKGLI